ncbi:hypothetical protein ARHIZOSPH14_04340 [Agromyces rhizosphaerae]|uniref:Polysaccharide pyruvyl transferase domain-containing protein n=1 Tax=Agromyces rhizosphaerae TaxID=88374 RepID=A0A9W6FQ42_9MICO|nr:polysaccharide pyruvyl transferase family protein [Agromyces rhizosphaerae]GLI26192.1 hypothetical protein ARHIZOSPH14_04340 [Agromyces rhizosphaerae]
MPAVTARARRALSRLSGDPRVLDAIAGVAIRRALRRRRPGRLAVLLGPPGRGNIGDQALVEAFCENVTGPVVVVVRASGDVEVPAQLSTRVRVEVLPGLLYGGARSHARDAARLGRLLADASSFSVVGADIMDGAYAHRASIARANLAARASRAGIDSRILGFSWNDAPHPGALAAVRRASRSGVRLLARDPVSASRLAEAGVPTDETADIVFSARTTDSRVADRVVERVGDDFAIVNASGLVAGDHDQLDDLEGVVDRLRAGGRGVLILPHVSRPGGDDIAVCRELAARVDAGVLGGDRPPSGVLLIDRLVSPAEIRGLARRARLTVTGRMHLAIMSIMHGVPAVTVSTQGKVEGLMERTGTPGLCIAPGPGFGDRVHAALDAIESGAAVRERVRAAAPRLVADAERNLDGLPAAGAGA